MREYCLTHSAVTDLARIKSGHTDKYVLEIRHACAALAVDPSLGTLYEGFNPNYKYYFVNDHVIYYRTTDNILLIAAILNTDETPHTLE